jgi:hypothetical protein
MLLYSSYIFTKYGFRSSTLLRIKDNGARLPKVADSNETNFKKYFI